MDRFFRSCAWAIVLFAVPVADVVDAQTITVREINPTRSDTGGNAATGGRVNHLARATDSIFYAASEFGGLFKSADAGRTWARLDAHLPTRTSDVKASPADPERVIATSLYDGRVSSLAGINVSSDGGATWRKPASASSPAGFCSAANLNEPSAFGIAFDPEDASHVFVGTNCGLARSTDGGLNWTFINPGPGTLAGEVFGVAVHHGGIIDTCGSGGHRRSTNGGAAWTGPDAGGTPLPTGGCSIAASPDESYVLFATVSTSIFETDNGGGSWNTRFVNPALRGRVPFVVTNKRQGRNFDLWFGDVTLFRGGCATPVTPAPGGAARCPASSTWTSAAIGAHADMGDVVFTNPPRVDVTVCRQNCTDIRNSCQTDCIEFRNSCLAESGRPGGPLAAACAQEFIRCRNRCTSGFSECNATCSLSPEGCPVVMASDGGTYFNTVVQTPACQTPRWNQPNVTTRGLWLWSLDGGNIPNSLTREGLYMGAQDDGSFATLNAGSASPTWTNPDCCDVFDTVSDNTRVVYTLCCFSPPPANRIFRRNAGMTGGGEIPNYPGGDIPGFGFPDVIAQFGPNRYGVIASGVFITQDITAGTISWTRLGINPPTNACGLWAAGPATSPTFFALTGVCSGNFAGTLMRYNGISTTGTWQNVALPTGVTGVGVFAVDPNNANRLFISAFGTTGVRMQRSSNGGTTWTPDTTLDGLMNGGGTFRMRTSNYAQPTMVAFDPNDSNNLLAGAADAGIFLSQNNGASWTTVTNNSGNSANPIIPRPHWAYFNRECSQFNIFVGTQGRGAWHFSYRDPAGTTVSACQARCETSFPDCQSDCRDLFNDCLSEIGRPRGRLRSQCDQAFVACRARCSSTRNACRQRCVDCPQ